MFNAWRQRRSRGTNQFPALTPLSRRARTRIQTPVLVIFFGIFFLIGAGLFYVIFVRAVIRIFEARNWRETPCVVLSNQVRTHSGSDNGATYSVDIEYEYQIDGHRYSSKRYQFLGASSSGHAGKAEIVRRYPPDRMAICYVDPNDPTSAVIERGFTSDMWFAAIPAVFMLVGLGGLAYAVRLRRKPESEAISRVATRLKSTEIVPSAAATHRTAVGPVVLKPAHSRITKFVVLFVFGLIWNAIIFAASRQMIDGWQRGGPNWFFLLFLTPFVLVGLLLMGLAIYFLLGIFNPLPVLRVSSEAVPLGGTLDVEWELTGRRGMIGRFRIELEGREEATYRRGTSTATDRNVFARLAITETTSLTEMRRGRASVVVPVNTIHTFKASNNRILWNLKVRGAIPHWPDIDEEFEIFVLPHPLSAA